MLQIRNQNKTFIVLSTLFLILLLTFLFLRNIRYDKEQAVALAVEQARASYNKDLVYRRWVAKMGGVYVELKDSIKPNPYLEVDDKIITGSNGKQYTLINPAFMTRQVHELASEQYGTKGHITSRNPINPGNTADSWEDSVLRVFDSTHAEVSEITLLNGQSYLRYMEAMWVEPACLKCHEKQGYSLGDIRGGISTSVPMNHYNEISRKSTLYHARIYSVILLSYLTLLIPVNRYMNRETRKRQELQMQLTRARIRTEEAERERHAKELHDGLGPLLSTCKIYLHSLPTITGKEKKEVHFKRTLELLDDAMDSVKEISNNLSPHVLRNFGLSKALETFLEKINAVSAADLSITSNTNDRLPELIEFTLYRTLIELTNNSIKHSHASAIHIDLHNNSDTITARYTDNGIGFNYEEVKKAARGLGLYNMERRIHNMKGKYHYQTSPNQGVQVEISLPTTETYEESE